MNQVANSRFKFFPQLNELDPKKWLSSRTSLSTNVTDEYFASDSLQDKFLRAIARQRMLPVKEVFESFEFFTRIRKSMRRKSVADLCCGHGLLGLLFAIFEPAVERVVLIDRTDLESRQQLINIAATVAPWIIDKIELRTEKINSECGLIEDGCAIVSAHACGTLTDLCIEIAIKHNGPIAMLPCCYPQSACQAPLSLQTALGIETAFDIDRTYRLEAAGYRVRWGTIPPAITPMNRIIHAQPKFTRPRKLEGI